MTKDLHDPLVYRTIIKLNDEDSLFLFFSDELFLQAFREHGIEHIVNKLTSYDNPVTVQELASKVLIKLTGESESSNTSSSE